MGRLFLDLPLSFYAVLLIIKSFIKISHMEIKEMIELAKANSEKGYSLLYNQYYKTIHNVAYNIVKNQDLADDLTSEVFLKAFRKIDKYSKDISFEMWLKTIANNHCIDFIRSSVKLKDNVYIDDDQSGSFDMTDFSNPERDLIKKEHSALLTEYIASLGGRMGLAMHMFVYDQKTYKEIAEAMNLSIGTIKNYLHRAKKQVANQQKTKTNEKKSILLNGNKITG